MNSTNSNAPVIQSRVGDQSLVENLLTRDLLVDVAFVRECVDDAQRAIESLWFAKGRTFWRSTRHREREAGRTRAAKAFFPTVTLRCIAALASLCTEQPDWASRSTRKQLFDEYIPAVLARTVSDLKVSTLDTTGTAPNVFTLSIYAQTFAKILAIPKLEKKLGTESRMRLQTALSALVRHPRVSAGNDLSRLHPFIAYQIKRTLIVGNQDVPNPRLRIAVRDLAVALDRHCRTAISDNLSKQVLGSLNPSEAVALAFCAATLAVGEIGLRETGNAGVRTELQLAVRLGVSREDRKMVLSALSAALEAQDASGCWPLGRVIQSEDKDLVTDRLEITTFEVAEAVCEAVIGVIQATQTVNDERSDVVLASATTRLLRSARYAERSALRLNPESHPLVGWCSDHAYGSESIESWTSANVLETLIAFAGVAEERNRRLVLASFTCVSPQDRGWPQWLRWDIYRKAGEVDHHRPVLEYLHRNIVEPIRRSRRGHPPSGTASVLLFGPPGTSKTTIVKGIADALVWPVVVLSPSNFIERGLEYIEAQAKSVFDRLQQLSRTVVIFDECDELFRDRAPRSDTEQTRGITAFVTASMLPKLQDLHDRGRIVFFICTNNFESMDPAVKRGGRIDHILGVGPPDKEARKMIIASSASATFGTEQLALPKYWDDASDELANESVRFTRPELVRAAASLLLQGSLAKWPDKNAARTAARQLVEGRVDGLTITTKELERFTDQRNRFSHAYIEGA